MNTNEVIKIYAEEGGLPVSLDNIKSIAKAELNLLLAEDLKNYKRSPNEDPAITLENAYKAFKEESVTYSPDPSLFQTYIDKVVAALNEHGIMYRDQPPEEQAAIGQAVDQVWQKEQAFFN